MSKQLQAIAPEIAKAAAHHPEVAALWIFGSVARNEAQADSDLDVAVLFRRRGEGLPQHHRSIRKLSLEIEALTNRTVDVLAFEAQGPILRHRILHEGVCVHEADRERRVDAESDTYSRYFDYRPTWNAAARQSVDGLRRWLEARQ